MQTVIHVNDKLTISGGVEVYLSQLQPLLRERGWNSSWIEISLEGSQVQVQSQEEHLCWNGRITELSSAPFAKQTSGGNGIFHVHSLSTPSLLKKLFNIAPVIRTMHEPRLFCPGQGKFWTASETVCPLTAGFRCLFHAYTKRCCNRHPKRLLKAYRSVMFELEEASSNYSLIIANSSWIRKEAVRAGVQPQKVEVVHYFTPTAERPEKSDLTEKKVAFAGRLSRTKGVHYLLQAMAIVHNEIPEARLEILGSGHDESEFRELCSKLGLSDVVTFHGWCDRNVIDQQMSTASVVAFPSIYPEAFGISGIEAMMRGKPVVGFDVGGVSDWLDDGHTGIAVPVKNVDAFAQGLLRLLDDNSLRERMGRAARKSALTKFSSKAHLAKLLPIYQSCLTNS